MLGDNQYPDFFIDFIIKATLCKLVDKNDHDLIDKDCDNKFDLSWNSNACLDVVQKKDKFRFMLYPLGENLQKS